MLELVPVTAACVMQAASIQQVPPQIILGLLKTEGGRVGMESPNRGKDGKAFSYDLGPMQVNDRVWVPVVADMHFGGDHAAARRALRDHGCYNVHIGAWIYRQYVDEAKGDLAEAVGYYNSHTPSKKRAYQRRFSENFMQLFGGAGKGG